LPASCIDFTFLLQVNSFCYLLSCFKYHRSKLHEILAYPFVDSCVSFSICITAFSFLLWRYKGSEQLFFDFLLFQYRRFLSSSGMIQFYLGIFLLFILQTFLSLDRSMMHSLAFHDAPDFPPSFFSSFAHIMIIVISFNVPPPFQTPHMIKIKEKWYI